MIRNNVIIHARRRVIKQRRSVIQTFKLRSIP
jgi:hypothetical protein